MNLLVSVSVKPDKREKFLAAIAENIASSVRDEPGCHPFDVFENQSTPNHFFYYERYTDHAAFDAHKASPHFAVWREIAEDVIVPGSQHNTFGRSVTTVIASDSV